MEKKSDKWLPLAGVCGIDRKIDDHLTDDYRPLYEMACSRTARKTYMTLQVEHQPDPYALGLHRQGSLAVKNYIANSMAYRYMLVCRMFDEDDSLVAKAKESA